MNAPDPNDQDFSLQMNRVREKTQKNSEDLGLRTMYGNCKLIMFIMVRKACSQVESQRQIRTTLGMMSIQTWLMGKENR